MKIITQFKQGIFSNNPALVQLIGLCSVLAISNTVSGAFGMGMSVIVVLTASNIVISLLRNFIPNEIRIPAFIVVIASFVTLLQMLVKAYLPALYDALGVFLPLIVVNCIILGRAESFASKNKLFPSLIDGIANGLGYTFVITTLALVREFFINGGLFGVTILPESYRIPFFGNPASSFMLLGCFIAITVAIRNHQMNKRKGAN